MLSDIEAIVDTFLYPTVPSTKGFPTYSTIKESHLKLNANAAAVQSNLGDGNNGHIHLTVSEEVYNTLSDVAFIEPANREVVPTFPQNTSQRLQMEIQSDENRKVFNEFRNTYKALKQLLLSTVNDMFIKALKIQSAAIPM